MMKDWITNNFFDGEINGRQRAQLLVRGRRGRWPRQLRDLGPRPSHACPLLQARVMHYIKVLQREQIGTWREREDLERELQRWLDEYVGPSDASPHREGEEQVVAALLRDPTDADALAVYADWLEQHGRHAEAALARPNGFSPDF